MKSNRLLVTDILILVLVVTYLYAGWVRVFLNYTIPSILVATLTIIFFIKKVWTGRFYYSPFSYILFLVGAYFLLIFTLNNGFEVRYLIDMSLPFLVFSIFFDYFLSARLISINRVMNVAVLLILLSGFIALMQYLGFSTAWELRNLLPTNDTMIMEQLARQTTPSGMAYYGVQLSYHLTLGIFILFLCKLENTKHLNPFVIYSCLFLFFVGILCDTSSFVISLILFLISFFFLRTERFNFALATGFLIFFIPISAYSASQVFTDSSSLTRLTFLILGWDILLSNPEGLAREAIEQAKIVAIASFYLEELVYSETILFTSFHNTFLNIGVHLGIIPFILYISVYLGLIVYYLRIRIKGSEFLLYSAIGSSALIAYLAQCLTHNAGPFTSDPYFWIFNGMLMGIIKRTEIQKRKEI